MSSSLKKSGRGLGVQVLFTRDCDNGLEPEEVAEDDISDTGLIA